MWAYLLRVALCLTFSPANYAFTPSEQGMSRAKAVLDEFPVIDGHNDFPMGLRDVLDKGLRLRQRSEQSGALVRIRLQSH